jgi:adenylate cyclase
LVGNIGSDVLMSYMMMGETVNLASRPEGANKIDGGRILTTETTVKMAGDARSTASSWWAKVVGAAR